MNDDFKSIEDTLSKSAHIRDQLTLKLDGSPEASSIERVSNIRNELLFVDRSQWRVFRQSPFFKITQEWMKSSKGLYLVSPSNSSVLSTEPVSESIWIEVVLAPLQWANRFGLQSGGSLQGLIDKLGSGPLEKDGQKMELETRPNGVAIKYQGSFLNDKKTKVLVEGTWELLDSGKVSPTDLLNSMTRTL